MTINSKRTALLVGASGLIGGHLLEKLLHSPYYDKVIVLARRTTPNMSNKLTEIIIDFDNLVATQIVADDVFCCLGTTIKKAGSKEAFKKVDRDYPLRIAKMAKDNGAKKFLIVTALGADPSSTIFYNRVKGEVEQGLKALDFEALHIFRPSLLLGERIENRPGERMGAIFSSILNPLMIGSLRKFRAIDSHKVASAMLANAKESKKGVFLYKSDELQNYF